MKKSKIQTLIVKSNTLVEASYRLTAVEQKIILTLVSKIKKDDIEFQRYNFKISEFLELMDIKDQSKYKHIPVIAEGLMKKVITIQEGNNILKVAWLSGVRVLRGEGIVEMEFSPYLKPYLLQLKKRFTSYKLQDVIQLKSAYSVRIYELLKQYETLGQRIFTIDELRYILAIQENEYKLYHQFKQRILLHSQNEIKKKTDIAFDFEEIKKKRKVVGIKFIVKSNTKATYEACFTLEGKSTNKEEKSSTESINAVKSMFKENITGKEAEFILNTAKSDINIIKEKYALSQNVSKIDNIVGWMIKAIKENYTIPKDKAKVGSFNDYEQRDYDFNELERQLLGWDEEETVKETGEEFQQLSMK